MNVKPFPDGVHPLEIYISSIEKRRITERIEGRHGVVDKGFTYETRPIDIEFLLVSNDTADYRLLRDEVYAYLQEDDYFYVSEVYQKGKRYKVTVSESFIPDRKTPNASRLLIPLETNDSPFAESVHTTQGIQQHGIELYFEEWAFGMGIPLGEDLKYTHEGNMFRIFNAGNVEVHPFEQELKIKIENVQGSDSFFELRNLTNNTKFRVTEPISDAQTIVIDGPKITSNGLAYARNTTLEYIELSPGWNEFEISGASSAKIAFDFRFYYK